MYQLPVQGQGPVVIHSKTFTFWNAASSPRSVFFRHHQPPISGSFLEGLTEQKLTNLAQGDLARALSSYQAGLALNPAGKNAGEARRIIDELTAKLTAGNTEATKNIK